MKLLAAALPVITELRRGSSRSKTMRKGKMKEEVSSIWKDWVTFIQNETNIKKFHPYSPEYHNVIRAGRIVSWRPNLDEKLYQQHLEEKKDKLFALPASTIDFLNLVIDSADMKEYKKKMKHVPDDDENEIVFDFLEAVFRAYHDIYSCKQDIEDGEATFNDLLIVPFLKAVANAIANETNSDAEFKMGEAPLIAMKKQLKDNDDANLYKADGIIKLYSLREPGVLLETPYHFGSKDKTKTSFDHHKGLFGSLSMLKTIADEFYLRTIEIFSRMKVLFVHATDTTVYMWSLRQVEEGPACELWLEESLDLDTKFDQVTEQLSKALNFYWKMKYLLQKTVDVVRELEVEHKKVLKQYRFASFPDDNLSSLVNPNIMKLTEVEDKAGMGEMSPFYT